jgi:hypothetical protein
MVIGQEIRVLCVVVWLTISLLYVGRVKPVCSEVSIRNSFLHGLGESERAEGAVQREWPGSNASTSTINFLS